jgi:hypothetical protein
VGVLHDIAAADGGDGGGDAALLRGPRRAALRARRRRIRMALLPLLRRPRAHRHLDGAPPSLCPAAAPMSPLTCFCAACGDRDHRSFALRRKLDCFRFTGWV